MPNIPDRAADAARIERMSGQHIFGRDHVSKTQQLVLPTWRRFRQRCRRQNGSAAAGIRRSCGLHRRRTPTSSDGRVFTHRAWAFERGEDTPLRQFASLLETAMANPEAATLIRTSFGESLDTYRQNAQAQRRLNQALGVRLYASVVGHGGYRVRSFASSSNERTSNARPSRNDCDCTLKPRRETQTDEPHVFSYFKSSDVPKTLTTTPRLLSEETAPTRSDRHPL